ncbi:MAG: ANTAR domain-containing protein [Lachnospiraceae bacterium]|nr:ANTAR domain-containing protein [Lachnospiraceae bacterium]
MSRIIIAFPKLDDAKNLKNVLNRNGYDDILACNSASYAIAAANESDGGIVLCGYRLPDMHYSELYGYLPREFQMLLVASPARLQECSIGNIMCLAMPVHSHELVSTVQTMLLELERLKRKPGIPQPKKRSEKEQRVIDDAKALLMERNNLSESEAHKYIQKLSMDSGNNLVETAEMILAFNE